MSVEIAERTSLSPVVQNLLDKLRLESSMGDDGAFVTQDSIAEKILQAATEDEIFAAADAGTVATKNFVGRPFRLSKDAITVRVSTRDDIEGGMGYYLLLRVTDLQTDEEVILNTGAQSLVTTIIKLRDDGHFDKYEKDGGYPFIIKTKPAGNGDVLILQPFKAAGSAKKN